MIRAASAGGGPAPAVNESIIIGSALSGEAAVGTLPDADLAGADTSAFGVGDASALGAEVALPVASWSTVTVTRLADSSSESARPRGRGRPSVKPEVESKQAEVDAGCSSPAHRRANPLPMSPGLTWRIVRLEHQVRETRIHLRDHGKRRWWRWAARLWSGRGCITIEVAWHHSFSFARSSRSEKEVGSLTFRSSSDFNGTASSCSRPCRGWGCDSGGRGRGLCGCARGGGAGGDDARGRCAPGRSSVI